jgi:Arc/MetJ family transcription regulator
MLRTNIVLDDELVEEAFRVSRAKTKRELVDEALRELVRSRSQPSLLELKGKIHFAKGYDHRKLRSGG